MTKKIISLFIAASLFLFACQNVNKSENTENKNSKSNTENMETGLKDISFTVTKNYFVNNTFEKLDNPKIESLDKFNEVFGMAALMGDEGKPTEIDFEKQYVIAVILPETDFMTNIEPVSLQKNDKEEIVFSYKNIIGQKQTYTTIPFIAIIVDKTENGKIILNEIK